jgi:hypothetical protein
MSAKDSHAASPACPHIPVPATNKESTGSSGSGASTALTAMLKKRQQRASHDTEPAGVDGDEPAEGE